MSRYVIDDRSTPRFRVHRSTMVDPEVFAQEQAKIFESAWVYVGHESEVPARNDYRTRTVAGRPVILVRDQKEQVRVFLNSCPHRGTLLCRSDAGNERFLKCFYHSWTFDTSGRLRAIPDDESYGPDFDREHLGLATPPRLDSYRGFVFVSFAAEGPDLRSYLGRARHHLDVICDQALDGLEVLDGSHRYSMRANWKLLVENSFDGYHAISTHQRYVEMMKAGGKEFRGAGIGESWGQDLGGGHGLIQGRGPAFGRPLDAAAQAEHDEVVARVREVHGDRTDEIFYGGRNLVIFPNLVVIDLVSALIVRTMQPVAPDFTEITSWELVPRNEAAHLRTARLDNFLTFWGPGGLATPDDVEALESCQRGFAGHRELPWSDISRGMRRDLPGSADEVQMRGFWRRWNQLLTGEEPLPEPHRQPTAFASNVG
ncbi:aromatic-ring-hydroxylating dioxygenase subunit alpha [Nocardioides humi]|uniref:Aromatic-ring-hydroxylating dioxygenase subunit alpha n=1 Tax=Nocardioides humi TaxID=449461 RepID=A0ABN2BQK7_9ACTN